MHPVRVYAVLEGIFACVCIHQPVLIFCSKSPCYYGKWLGIFLGGTGYIFWWRLKPVKNIIDSHNRAVVRTDRKTKCEPCNCTQKNLCPLDGQCREKNIIYLATVISNNVEETYIGLTENEFKTRYGNHKQSFKDQKHRYSTELSKHVWKLKDNKQNFDIKWKIMGKAKPYSNVTKKCNLCLLEKYLIICHSNKATLNKKSELVGGCRHKRKFLLIHHKTERDASGSRTQPG